MTAGLRITELSTGYGSRHVIEKLSLGAMERGTVTALVGPNAAGKSTLLRAIAGLVRSTGRIELGAIDLAGASMVERARHVAFMPQTISPGVSLSVIEGVIASLRSSPAFEGLISAVEAERRAFAMLDRLDIADLAMRPLSTLSGGQRQLASLAQASVRDPALLLLDEPTSALDPRHQHRVMREIRRFADEGRTVVVVLHDLGLAAQFADRVVILSCGALFSEGVPETTMTPAMLQAVYGVEARVERCSQGRLQILIDAETADVQKARQ